MNTTNEQTPSPLSFDSPQVQAVMRTTKEFPQHVARWNERILADALTHEHEARVRAEQERDSLRKALEVAQPYVVWSDPEGRSADDYPAAKAIVERDAKLVTAMLSGLPAQAGEVHPSVLLAHRILAVLVENGYIERGIYEECQLIMGAFIVGLLTDEPSAGALGEREDGK